ncbi:hypothetical protein JCM10207_005009 [Rhodosporidiobolus poonsookiae]
MDFAPPPGLLFPSAVSSLQADRGAIRSQLRDTYNRLHSISHDANFVHDQVAPAFPDFPLVANQRAGAWYVKASDEKAHAYFKSTDGHANEHNFNLRRANLALLPLIKERQGIIFVDSTRRGKRFPDALSKTIPLWCAVLNKARVTLLPPSPENSDASPEEWKEQGALFTSPQAVGRSEHSQIEVKIDGWAKDLASSAYDLSALTALRRPLRPFFVSPSSTLSTPQPASSFPSYYPIICASASKLADEADGMERSHGFTYVQGSGDDHEAWSRGLTPPVFWKNAEEILAAEREEIDEVIARILLEQYTLDDSEKAGAARDGEAETFTAVRSTGLALAFAADPASLPTPPSADRPLVIVSTSKSAPNAADTVDPAASQLHLLAKPGKAGYVSFFSPAPESGLSIALAKATARLRNGVEVRIAVARNEEGSQSEANDLGVAVALILLVRLFDAEAKLLPAELPAPTASKDLIRSRLQWILEAFPTVNPSRASLNKVNELLMSRGGRR